MYVVTNLQVDLDNLGYATLYLIDFVGLSYF
jgi:hypothetical protein